MRSSTAWPGISPRCSEIDEAALRGQRDGMRERAARIGARLDIAGGPRQGTTVTLAVPAAHAYATG